MNAHKSVPICVALCMRQCLTLNDVELQECTCTVKENRSDSLLKHAPFWPLKCRSLFLHSSAMLQAPEGVLLLQPLSALTNRFCTEVWTERGRCAALRCVNTDEGQLLCRAAYSVPAVGETVSSSCSYSLRLWNITWHVCLCVFCTYSQASRSKQEL